jgi:hypothetical protein
MSILAPLGLLALLTLPVIVILHFRRERLRRVFVPSLLLWQHIAPMSGKQRKLTLPISFLLLLHLLVATLLALALSHPQWLSNLLGSGRQHVAVIVDTSTSMAASEGMGTTRLDQARGEVRGIIESVGINDQFTLIAAASSAQLITTGGSGDQANLLAALDELTPRGTGTNIDGALTLAQVAQENSGYGSADSPIVVVSDRDPPLEVTLPQHVQWLRVGSTTDNRAIVALSARARRGSAGGYDVYTRITNYDNRPAVATLNLYADDEVIDSQTVDFQSDGELELTWDLPAGINVLRAELETNDALDIDNSATLSLAEARSISTVLVSETPSEELERALSAVPGLSITRVSPADHFNAPQNYATDLTIFESTLPQEWPSGGVLVINPPAGQHPLLTVEAATGPEAPPEGQLPARVELTQTDAADRTLDDLSLGGVDLAFDSLKTIQVPEWGEVRLLAEKTERLPDGTLGDTSQTKPLIVQGRVGESDIALWAFNLQAGNLTTKLAFPLLVARTVEALTTPAPSDSLLVGQTLTVQPGPRTERIELTGPEGETREFASARTLVIDNLMQTGLYDIREYTADTLAYSGQFAVNAGTPLESNLKPQPFPATAMPYIAEGVPGTAAAEELPENSQPQSLWPLLAVGALIILLIEWLYVHWR